ncbi:MAG: ATPase, T2SS/T4P/T4SS family, partial [Verrucomicrobiales bacterium]
MSEAIEVTTEDVAKEKVAVLNHVDDYLKLGQEFDCSDVHLATTSRPSWRRYGILQPIWDNALALTAEDTERLVRGFLNEDEMRRFLDRGDVDFAYATDFGRFRASVVRQRLGWDMAFRIINTTMRSMPDLHLPNHIKPLTQYQNGLVLVTGPVGSGKSTTLAALVDEINVDRKDHIITLED